MNHKFYLNCVSCGYDTDDVSFVHQNDQKCPKCNGNIIEVIYKDDLRNLVKSIVGHSDVAGLWRYFDYLPLLSKTSVGKRAESNISIDNWSFLEDYARKYYNVSCEVYAHRYDQSFSTGTWKDLSGALIGAACAENNISDYVIASTGNMGVALACYLTLNKLNFYAFIPMDSSVSQESEIACFGQKVYRVRGDYSKAKSLAEEFAISNKYKLSNGTSDIYRVEAKKTMTFEWYRSLDRFPTVYIQALSGGTGPIGVDKGSRELLKVGLIQKSPRQFLIQSEQCPPMADAYTLAYENGFKGEDWNLNYNIVSNPDTEIATLATGNPSAYPVVSKIVKNSGGYISKIKEAIALDIAKAVAAHTSIRIGPAAAIGVGGFFKALSLGKIKNGDIVMLNVGEGMRRSVEFMNKLNPQSIIINGIDDIILRGSATEKDGLLHSIYTQLETN